MFVTTLEEPVILEAIELVTASRRASATYLQRKLRIDFEQAMELLGVLAHREIIELEKGESQGRVLT